MLMVTRTLRIADIYVPAKKRRSLDPETVNEIAESMIEEGQRTAILVRPDGERFVLVEGLHRLEACKALGEDTIQGCEILKGSSANPVFSQSRHSTGQTVGVVRQYARRPSCGGLAAQARHAQQDHPGNRVSQAHDEGAEVVVAGDDNAIFPGGARQHVSVGEARRLFGHIANVEADIAERSNDGQRATFVDQKPRRIHAAVTVSSPAR